MVPRIVVHGNLVIHGNVYISGPPRPSGNASGSEDSEYSTGPRRPDCTCTSSVCTSCSSFESSSTSGSEYRTRPRRPDCTCTSSVCTSCTCSSCRSSESSSSSGYASSGSTAQDNVPGLFDCTPIPVPRAPAVPVFSEGSPFEPPEDLLLDTEVPPHREPSPAPEPGPANPPPRRGPLYCGPTMYELRTMPATVEQLFDLYYAHVSTTTFVVLILWKSAEPINWHGEPLRALGYEFNTLRGLNHTAQVLHGVIQAGKEICLYREDGNGGLEQFTFKGRTLFHEEHDLWVLRQWRDRVPREKIEGVSDTESNVSSPYRPRLSSNKFLNLREEDLDPR
ncbi:hypothetical protein BO86DRAFT_430671 [Aspergillus japonicus CBS 114.51]|uniref:Uncharacterized protein n=1 Tax=Aspergillus japonicus CBS 114.51 TaxID=1448312 RepID=A0A8T8X0V1_ASPJA|nr:hypothetical protein BO86DRAFT_430671 [Aspergillus japonicus CBS 114.51]RAH81661.1 hypothetical protein BO86DRAFT_430671 [Aspergillus japonicus CBS 114.51]